MNYLDLYLQRHHCKRYDVYKKTGVSQQLLATHINKSIEKYSSKVIIAIAETLDKTPGDVLNELLLLEKEKPTYEAYNPNDLLVGLKSKYDKIIIQGAYYKEVKKIMHTQLSDNELLGVELGSAGVLSILIFAIESVMCLFSNSEKIEKEIERRLQLYNILEMTDESLVLGLKQLDY